MKTKIKQSDLDQLRQKAEALRKNKNTKFNLKLSESESTKLFLELEMHQLELEKMNDELQLANEKTEIAVQKYSDLFDFAPSGYFTISKEGQIIESNFYGAAMLNKTKSDLLKHPFTSFIKAEERNKFTRFLSNLFTTQVKETCEVELTTRINKPSHILLTGISNEIGDLCFVTATDITEKVLSKQKLESQNILLNSLINSQDDLNIFSLDKNYCYTSFNTNHFLEMQNAWNIDIKIGANILDCIHIEEKRNHLKTNIDRSLKGESFSEIEYQKNLESYYEFSWSPIIENFYISGTTVFIKNITDRKRELDEIVKLNRILSLNSKINYIIIRTHDRNDLFQEICNTVTGYGGFRMSWIGLIDNASKILVPICWAGHEADYLASINLSTITKFPEELGPTGDTGQKGTTTIFNDIANIKPEGLWQKEAVQRHYRSSISLPIKIKDKTLGVFTIYSEEINFFSSQQEIFLLEKITTNISFSLEKIYIEEDYKISENKLRQISQAVEQSPVSIIITDINGTIEYINPKFTKLTGYELSEVIGKNPRLLKSGFTSQEEYRILWDTILKNEEWRGEFQNRKKNGELYWESATISPLLNSSGKTTHFLAFKEDITEQKKSQEIIRKANKEIKLILEIADEGIIGLDENGNHTFVNPLASKMLGYEIHELLGKPSHSLYHHSFEDGTSYPLEKCPILKTLNDGNIHRGDDYFWKKDGTSFPVHFSSIPIKEGSKIIGAVITFRDITIRKQAELRLKESETRFRLLAENARDVIFRYEMIEPTHFSYVSPSIKNITGYSANNLLANPDLAFKKLVHPEDLHLIGKIIEGGQQSQKPIILRWVRKDGKIIWIEQLHTLIYDFDKNLIAIEGFGRDISDRKIVDERLIESENKFRSVLQSAHDSIILANENGNIIYWNDYANKIFGYEQQEIIGKLWTSILPKRYRKIYLSDLTNHILTVQSGSSGKLGEFKGLKKDGTEFPFDISLSFWESNNKKYYCAIIRDITERKKSEHLLEAKNTELQKTNKELDRFVYSTSHDLRAPLKSLLGLINIVDEELNEFGNTLQHDRLQMMEKTVTKLDNFIEEIINYSRNNRLEIAYEEINFNELIQEIRESHKFMDGAQNLKLIVEIKNSSTFFSDKRRISIILNNLISNAVKYQDVKKESPHVKCSIFCSEINANIIIEDNGIGVAEKDLTKIFEMFYRATKISTGSGLGLYLVKETIDTLGGKIYTESELNVGTKFTINIPNLKKDN